MSLTAYKNILQAIPENLLDEVLKDMGYVKAEGKEGCEFLALLDEEEKQKRKIERKLIALLYNNKKPVRQHEPNRHENKTKK